MVSSPKAWTPRVAANYRSPLQNSRYTFRSFSTFTWCASKEFSVFKQIRVSAGPMKDALRVAGVLSNELTMPASLRGRKGGAPKSKSAAAGIAEAPGFKADAGEIFVLSSADLLLGLGKPEELNAAGGADGLRVIGARLIRRLDKLAAKSIALDLPLDRITIDARAAGRCLGEGMGLANWRFDDLAGKATKIKPALPSLAIGSDETALREGIEDGIAVAASANYARRIAATPPNICTPAWVGDEAKRLAREVGLRARIITFEQAQRLGMGGIVNVGKGSANKPCLIVLEHKPQRIGRSAKDIKLALVGKTITYDTGGYSLKINNTMKGMKYDKCGGMAVLGAMHAAATLKLPVHVVGVLTCAENMVSSDSYRPDDIITMYNGVSVEVTNTDAEGRLVLADALAYACKDIGATHIVDLATLTGGVVIALGHFCAGVFCNDAPLLQRVNTAAESSGEKVWQLPLWKDHKEFMRSQHADILNSNAARSAHPIQGAAFLAYFVDEKIPWAHIDIAGMSNVDSDKDLFMAGPTGYGVRLLIDLMRGFAR
jgi:leucyl aminopeptidase